MGANPAKATKIMKEAFIIPAKYYRGFLGRLREKDLERWRALVDKEREKFNSKVLTV